MRPALVLPAAVHGISRSDRWEEIVRKMSPSQVRQIAIDHPQAFPLVATRHPAAPWLRPPLQSVELVNTFLRNG